MSRIRWAVFLFAFTLACGSGKSSDVSVITPAPPPTAIATETPIPTPAPVIDIEADSGVTLAPDFAGIDGWINSEPLQMTDLRGKVVLIDFWTYTCINCIRTFPHLKEWHAKYADKGLVVVGVHSPEFLFETERANVERAVADFGIEYAVAQDNSLDTWHAFDNRSWPGKFLIDKDGAIRYQHFGEGQYAQTEQEIRKLLAETGVSLADIPLNTTADGAVYPGLQSSSSIEEAVTRELYASYIKNSIAVQNGGDRLAYVANFDYFDTANTVVTYTDPGNYQNHHLYLEGVWHNGQESLTHARQTTDYEDYVAIEFYSNEVNIVVGMERSPYEVRVTLDDAPLRPDQVGEDIQFDTVGNSYLLVDEARMFNIVRLSEFETHELKISSNSDEFSIYTYTFGHYQRTPKELLGITGWINTDPFSLADLRGKVVLVVFFSVVCDDCIQTYPFLESWQQKYSDHGLVVVGVHTPQFQFERSLDTITGSLDERGVRFAVAVDENSDTWDAFQNWTVPGMYLLGKNGFIRHMQHGPGGYTLMEQNVRHWLMDTDADVSQVTMKTQQELEPDPRIFAYEDDVRRTRDLYFGTSHNGSDEPDPFFQQAGYFEENGKSTTYRDPGGHRNHYAYIGGVWRNDAESLIHARDTDEYDDYIAFKMVGKTATAVLGIGHSASHRVRVTMDGAPVPPEFAGDDLMYDNDGDSYLVVDRPDVYRLVDLPEYGSHELVLWSDSDGLEIYVITFEANVFEPEPF